MKNQSTSVTVGIPTYYGGSSLVKTVESIRASTYDGPLTILVSVDGKPLDSDIRKQLIDLGVRVIENKERGGQVARIRQIVSLCETDLLIQTQDDILFTPHTVTELVKGFEEHPNVTMESGKVVPLPATNFFEKVVHVGVSISYTIGKHWNRGDNYFLAGGRCLAFQTEMAKKLDMPEEVLNSDTYLYFLNQKLGGSFYHVPSAIYFMRSPKTLADHMKQSKKYQHVSKEIQHYLGIDITNVQPLPASLRVLAFVQELLRNPLLALCYLGVLFYTRSQGKDMYENVTRFWDTDASTKEL